MLEARRRSRGGLEFRASWTWAKAIDYGQSGGATPRTNAQFDPFDVRYDKGLSALNYPHKIVAECGVGAAIHDGTTLVEENGERLGCCTNLYGVEREALQPGYIWGHGGLRGDMRVSTAREARCICRRLGEIRCGCQIPGESICV